MTDKVIERKIVLLGDTASEKNKLLLKYTNSPLTLGVEFANKNISHGDKSYRLQIWDTAGHTHMRAITRTYCKGAHGFMIIFDVTKQSSYNNAINYIKEIASMKIPFIIVGNQCNEMAREVSLEQGKSLATENGSTYIEVVNGDKVDTAFDILLKMM